MKTPSSLVSLSMHYLAFILVASGADAAVHTAVKIQQGAHSQESKGTTGISPELEPESSKKFFDKDYPEDKRAVVDSSYKFGHPYPAVQDSNDFDADFVKDENSDGGRWQAQMDYDTLRAKIREFKDKMKTFKEKMEEENEEWLDAKKKLADHQHELEETRKAVEEAEKAYDEASKKVNELEGASGKPGTQVGGAVGDAIHDVQKEMDDLEDCKKKLIEAKKKLKELLEKQEKEKAEHEKEEEEAKAEEEAEKKKEEEEKKAKEEEEKKKEGEKDAHEKKDHEEEEELKKEVDKDQQKVTDLDAQYEKELQDVKETEAALEKAAKELRKFRRPPYVDDDGGVYNVPSLAAKHGPTALVAIGCAVALMMCS